MAWQRCSVKGSGEGGMERTHGIQPIEEAGQDLVQVQEGAPLQTRIPRHHCSVPERGMYHRRHPPHPCLALQRQQVQPARASHRWCESDLLSSAAGLSCAAILGSYERLAPQVRS